MESLDDQTRLKLSQKRNWFLERLLKLGTIDVKREYTCVRITMLVGQKLTPAARLPRSCEVPGGIR